MPTTEDAFWADVFANPGDPAPLLIFADWLDQHGDPDMALCCRWMGRRHRHPADRQHYRGPFGLRPLVLPKYRWGWYPDTGARDRFTVLRHAMIPRLLFLALRKGPHHAYYGNPKEAVNALAVALERLREIISPDGF